MRQILLLSLIFLGVSSTVFANQTPRGLATDGRIKIVAYNQEDVVTIHGNHLVSTAVFFGKDETILNVDMGDQIAWEVSVSKAPPNILFVKPKLPQSDTNMTVITNKRSYQFRLYTRISDTPQSKGVTYSLRFKYPDEEKMQFEAGLNSLQRGFLGVTTNDAVRWNYDYSFYGSTRIAPIQAVDNGTFTIFKFPKQSVIPAIFAVDAYSNESLVNFRVEKDYVFVQGVHHQYTLRNGKEVTTIYNDTFNKNN